MNSVFQRSNLEGKLLNLVTELNQKEELQDGLFRRVNIIPLQRQFLGATADPLLINKLTGELDAITSRALDALGRLIDPNGNFTECVYETPHCSVSVQKM